MRQRNCQHAEHLNLCIQLSLDQTENTTSETILRVSDDDSKKGDPYFRVAKLHFRYEARLTISFISHTELEMQKTVVYR